MVKQLSKTLLTNNSVLQVITGSQAYGLSSENSDIDQKAIVILPPSYTITLEKEWETKTFQHPDIEFHSLKKTMRLLQSQNPTILELLFVLDQFVVKQTEVGEILRQHRELFLSQRCFYTFGGYAKDQLMRIKKGLKIATEKDQQIHLQYKLEQIVDQISKRSPIFHQYKCKINNVYVEEDDKLNVSISFLSDEVPLTIVNSYASELNNILKSYNAIKQDTGNQELKLYKHAMHLFRLLIVGKEVLQTGELRVYRYKDRSFLLDIRNGKYSWDQLFHMADELFLELENAKQKTVLPSQLDHTKINQLYYDLISLSYGIKQ